MRRLGPFALACLAAAPAIAQHHGHAMPAADPHAGHRMGAEPDPQAAAPATRQAPAGPARPDTATDPHAGHDMSGAAPPDPHAGHVMPAPVTPAGGSAAGTDLKPGTAPAPAPPADRYADRFWTAERMAGARDRLHREHGDMRFSQILFNLAEVQLRDGGRDGYRWDGEGWFGGDLNRLVVKTEGSGSFGDGGPDEAEVQALFSRALDAYWNLQAGLRYDITPDPSRTYASIGVEGLAPYWFDLEATLFLSNKGDLLGRLEGYYDQRLTNRLILQPRAELNLAAQDVPETRTGAGVSDVELGLRLRYEFARDFAPYLGLSWERTLGAGARYARADGEARTARGIVAGLRFWF